MQVLSEINNPQQSWGFEWEPPKAVMKDSGTRDWTLWGGKLLTHKAIDAETVAVGAVVHPGSSHDLTAHQ
jgi:hypothetical protein